VIAPGLSPDDRSGSEGSAMIDIPVELFGSVDHPVTVDYATSEGTALAGKDYEATTGTLTFVPGQTTKSVSVPVLADRKTETNETLTLTISNVDGGAASGPPVTVVKPDATATILDNDPKVKLGDVRVRAGNKGMGSANFMIKLSHASPDAVTIRFATANGSARARSDYKPVKTTITFLPGQKKQTTPVAIKGDRRNEPSERFFAKLSKVHGGVLGDAKGIATIVDND
jgi:large repetitive protein